jgi:hypothetical protein
MIHMTLTQFGCTEQKWAVYCRCGWVSTQLPTQNQARVEGDQHLLREHPVRPMNQSLTLRFATG